MSRYKFIIFIEKMRIIGVMIYYQKL